MYLLHVISLHTCLAGAAPRDFLACLTQTEHARPDVCVGAAHPQLPGAWRVGGVSQHRTSRGGLGKGATRARDFVIFKNMHASACDHHFLKKCARRAARCNFFKKYPCSSLRVARARASQGGWAHRAERAVLPQIHT